MNYSFLNCNQKLNFYIISHNCFFGSFAVVWFIDGKKVKVRNIILSRPDNPALEVAKTRFPLHVIDSCNVIEQLCDQINILLNGMDIKISIDLLDFNICPQFHQKVLKACYQIPFGKVSTYKKLAASVNSPKAMRAVGNALAKNPFPLVVPCHRVIRSNRFLGGFQSGLDNKIKLLKQEGIEFDTQNRVMHENIIS